MKRTTVREDGRGGRHLVAAVPFAAGDVVGPLTFQRILPAPHRHTLQLSEEEHAEGLGEFAYMDHACLPAVVVDTERRRVVAARDLSPGDLVSYAYPTTEWRMAEPFACHCGAPRCLLQVRGAAELSPGQLATLPLQPHILRLLGRR